MPHYYSNITCLLAMLIYYAYLLCISACMYVCMYVSVYVYMYVCMYVCIFFIVN